jgi:hypothetical protein
MTTAAELAILIKARDEASKTLDGIHGKVKGLGGALSGALKVGGLAAAGGIGIAVVALKGFVQEAAEAQKVQAQTNAVLASTKGIAGVTAAAVSGLANSLSSVIPIDDEVIQATENMLLTFTNVGKKVFPQATEAALDMATALGEDSVSSAMRLGKALNDPIAGVTALRRVGVQLTDAQKDQIQAMMDAGDVAGAQRVILQELNTEFGNSARAAGQTFAGKMKILQTQIGNVKEAIGMALLPVLTRFATFLSTKLAKHMDSISRGAENLSRAIADFFTTLQDPDITSEGVFGKIERFASDLRHAFDELKPHLLAVWENFKLGLRTIQPLFEFIVNHKPILVAAIAAIGVAILVALGPGAAAIVAIVGLITLIGFLARHWDEIKAKTVEVWTAINDFIDEHLGALKKLIIDVFNAIKTAIEDRLRLIMAVFQFFSDLFHGNWGKLWDDVKAIVAAAVQMVEDDLKARLKILADLFAALGPQILAALGDLSSLLFDIGKDIMKGLLDGLKKGWEDVSGWLGQVGGWIKGLKGPAERDAELLVQSGKLIMDGLGEGMRSSWGGLQGWLRTIGPAIAAATANGATGSALYQEAKRNGFYGIAPEVFEGGGVSYGEARRHGFYGIAPEVFEGQSGAPVATSKTDWRQPIYNIYGPIQLQGDGRTALESLAPHLP